ncbi:MAG: arylesterase [Alphaproteobacteria bacterium]|nr:arylesterase [Alphaproteobacteria bacterium]
MAMAWVPGVRAQDGSIRLALLGDSLTAGYGLAARDAFPARLGAALAAAGRAVIVQDAGVSGDTTAGGLARLDWVLGDAPDVVLVELGANDALRGLDPEAAYASLDAILTALAQRGILVVLAGFKAPRNLGPEYTEAFDGIYARLAERHGVPLYPFFLDGVALDPELNQTDGLHPNAAGVAVIVGGILPTLLPVIDTARRD